MATAIFLLDENRTEPKLTVVLPSGEKIEADAAYFVERAKLLDMVQQAEERTRSTRIAPLPERVSYLIAGHESVAIQALRGAASIRDDMVVYLRAIAVVVESVVDDHLNHRQKNERLRGVLGVIEREIDSLRNERFEFNNTLWRRDRDAFAWSEPERRLREENDLLRKELAALQGEKPEAKRGDEDEMPF